MWKESGGRTGGAVSSKGRLSAMRRNMTEIGRRTEEAILHQGITYLATAPWQTYYTKLLRDEGLRDEGAGSGGWSRAGGGSTPTNRSLGAPSPSVTTIRVTLIVTIIVP